MINFCRYIYKTVFPIPHNEILTMMNTQEKIFNSIKSRQCCLFPKQKRKVLIYLLRKTSKK